jgi:DNA invertase Pin-like site-specific DNA recombinase
MPIDRPRAYSYIRMSTPEQLKGHSKRRQLEKSIEYARAHDLEFADESQIEDIGVSAFRGANVKYGALGQFIEAVETGRVPAG